MNTQLTREEAPRLHQWLALEVHGAWEGPIPDWARDPLGRVNDMTALRAANEELLCLAQAGRVATFQMRSARWGTDCMGAELVMRKIIRVYRFFEESCELAQCLGMSASEAVSLVGYVWSRRIGEPLQEAGAAMMTLALLCQAHGIDMFAAGEAELARVSEPTLFERIRAKALAAPAGSSLPVAAAGEAAPEIAALAQALAERDALRVELERVKAETAAGALRWQGAIADLEGVEGDVMISASDLRALLAAKAEPKASQDVVAAAREVGRAAASGTPSTGHVHARDEGALYSAGVLASGVTGTSDHMNS
ncbi:hypothetical protein [Paraburkholderia youngii]|uniref:hypothetical protein n=1 Tax=Paraburkholderia youngii TaxID=2782701 RepID=UPI003D23559A